MRAINHLLLKLRATTLLLCWLLVLVGMPVTLTALTPVVHIQYDSSATNGNQYLAEPSTSAGFDTAYTYGAPTWEDDTVNGQSVKVMNFSNYKQWMLVDSSGNPLRMPGQYNNWSASMWLKWNGSGFDIPFALRHPTRASQTYHKITYYTHGGNVGFYGGYYIDTAWRNESAIQKSSMSTDTYNLMGSWVQIFENMVIILGGFGDSKDGIPDATTQ